MFKKRTLNHQSASRKKTVKPLSDSDSDESDHELVVKAPSDEAKPKFKKLKTNTDKKRVIGEVDYASSDPKSLSRSTNATRQDRLLAEDEEAYRKASEKEVSIEENDNNAEGFYKGQKGYTNYLNPEQSAQAKVPRNIGPMKNASNIRSTTTVDFQPDVCKDYKQTGYCGYGDTCKFLHLRDDAKRGWKITKEWEGIGKSTVPEDKLEKIPFKCPICKNNYKNPIVTPCGHYFCQACYLATYRKQKSCFICRKNTGGSMVVAKDLKQILLHNET